MSWHLSTLIFKGKRTAGPGELSEVLEVNGRICIAINPLSGEPPGDPPRGPHPAAQPGPVPAPRRPPDKS